MNNNYAMCCLSFEMTRRCNMCCDFCARGYAQNLDITKEIIDKSLYEIENVYLDTIRLNGGESFLCPDLIEYLITEIIRRKIYVNSLMVYTNGTILNDVIKKSLKKFIEYRKSIEPEIIILSKKFVKNRIPHYKDLIWKGVTIIISTDGHRVNDDIITEFSNYYGEISDTYFTLLDQTTTFLGNHNGIKISGLAKDNLEKIINTSVKMKDLEIIDNRYHFVHEFDRENEKLNFIHKNISIAANGNVFPGCLMEYEEVDKNAMFNICDCKNDFFARILNWCWNYPVNKKVKRMRENYIAIKWCIRKGIEIKDVNKDVLVKLGKHYFYSVEIEKIAKKLHGKYPEKTFFQIDFDSYALGAVMMLRNGENEEFIKGYLLKYSLYTDKSIDFLMGKIKDYI